MRPCLNIGEGCTRRLLVRRFVVYLDGDRAPILRGHLDRLSAYALNGTTDSGTSSRRSARLAPTCAWWGTRWSSVYLPRRRPSRLTATLGRRGRAAGCYADLDGACRCDRPTLFCRHHDDDAGLDIGEKSGGDLLKGRVAIGLDRRRTPVLRRHHNRAAVHTLDGSGDSGASRPANPVVTLGRRCSPG
jgi:hypothetical protein